ncbi:MAG: hypothetical protein AAGC88_01170 [Bacteroidota bacterium]
MFGLFSKKPKDITFEYVTYVTKVQKYKNVLTQFKANANDERLALIYFFDQTKSELMQLGSALNIPMSEEITMLSSPGYVLLTGQDFNSEQTVIADRVIFMEAHPIASVQRAAGDEFIMSDINTITCYVGLDEALFQVFGGSRLANVISKLGVQEDEPIIHTMVSKSIERAQKKLEKDYPFWTNIISSQEDWLKENKVLFIV